MHLNMPLYWGLFWSKPFFPLCYRMAEVTEPPFRPREKLLEKQKYFQNVSKYTYLKGPFDKVTSVAIPLALAASSLYLIVSFYFFFNGFFKPSQSGNLLMPLTILVCNANSHASSCVRVRVGGSITCRMGLERKNEAKNFCW